MTAEPPKETTSVPIVYSRPVETVTGLVDGGATTKPAVLEAFNTTVVLSIITVVFGIVRALRSRSRFELPAAART
jgi:hypothetical protein